MSNKAILKISVTGVSLALIIIVQFLGKILPPGFSIFGPFSLNQLVIGSFVNMILILLTTKFGIYCAAATGALSSVMAFLLQIGPIFPQIVAFISISNIIFVLVFYLISIIYNSKNKKYILVLGVVVSAIIKFLFLKLTIPWSLNIIKDITKTQIQVLTVMFSWPQLVTALTGGFLALFIKKRLFINKTN
ncbi:MAG: hypothetical protein J6C55_03505 [Oscillospiraceae bacterium]|nr:hypothetical protein [Oscillospiraceae bacterium]